MTSSNNPLLRTVSGERVKAINNYESLQPLPEGVTATPSARPPQSARSSHVPLGWRSASFTPRWRLASWWVERKWRPQTKRKRDPPSTSCRGAMLWLPGGWSGSGGPRRSGRETRHPHRVEGRCCGFRNLRWRPHFQGLLVAQLAMVRKVGPLLTRQHLVLQTAQAPSPSLTPPAPSP